ncbi:hypothetical protein QBC41DRAFT_271382 [Cercophora samala]|uniref:Uncharacterized protein n=1 Tax=Cercophora samala TaxID=330535 RepID=A0AA39ZHV5_9PEZI|nr:hypothetical protein QBC41DRAFT_271382 [Cercophora samala]
MAELANPFPVLSLAGVINTNGYCSISLAEAVLGCGTLDVELNGGSFRADILPDRIIITATEPYEEDNSRAEGSASETTETTSSETSVPSLLNRFAPASLAPANSPGLLWALDLQQASTSTIRSTLTSTRTSTRTSTSTSTSTSTVRSTSTSTARSTSTSTARSTSTSTLRSTSTSTSTLRSTSTTTSRSSSTPRPSSTSTLTSTVRSTSTSTPRPTTTIRSTSTSTRTSTRTSTSTSTSTVTRRFPFLTIGRSAASPTVTSAVITAPSFTGAPRFPPGRTLHTLPSSSTVTTRGLPAPVSPTQIPSQGENGLLSLHGVLNGILGRSFRAQSQDKDEATTEPVEPNTPKGSSNIPGPARPDTTEDKLATDVNNTTAATSEEIELTASCSRPGVSKLLDINLDLSRINIDLDLYLDILAGSSSSSSGGLVSGLLNGLLGRRDLKADLKAEAAEMAAEQREKAQKLKDRLRADAAEEKERVIKKTYEAKCGAVLAVPTASSSAVSSPTSTGVPPRRPAKSNNRPGRPEPAREITETVVTVEEVSEEVVVEECILKCERASVKASVKAGEVRECLGVTVRRRFEVDNCVYFVGGVEVVDLEVVLLIEEEVQASRLGEEEDETDEDEEEEDLRSDSFVPVRVRRQ